MLPDTITAYLLTQMFIAMNKISFVAVILIFGFVSVSAQPCLPDGITFNTQAQIDSFQINHPNCTEIEGDVFIIGGYDITNLNGLTVLTSIGGYFRIRNNDALTSLTGLEGLTSIGGYLTIHNNSELTSLTGLEGVTSIGGWLGISGNDALSSLTGLEGVTSIGGWLGIGGNDALSSLTGLEGMTSIEGNLGIEENASLTSLIGLDNVTSIEGYLWIDNNDNLTSLSGLENIISIGGFAFIQINDALTSLTGLQGVTSIGGDLSIDGNFALNSLTGLDNLTSIGGYLRIYNNLALTSLTALDNVTSIGGILWICNTAALTSLTGIDNIDANSISGLSIYGNFSLSNCEVESICAYLASPNGNMIIEDNKIGCNSPEEVQDSCEAHAIIIDKYLSIEACSVSPNPLTTSTTLSYTLNKPSTVTISIFNPQGQLIENIEQEQPKGEQKVQWNAEGLPAGIYYFRVQAGDKVGGGKMVKMS